MIKLKNTTSQEVIVINDVKWSGERVVSEKTAKGQKFIERVATMLEVKTTDAGEQYFVLRDGYEPVRGRNTTEMPKAKAKAQPKEDATPKASDAPKEEKPKVEPKAKDATPKATPTPTKAKEDAPKAKTPKATDANEKPNVPNAIAGVPTNMIAVKNVAIKQKVVNVCYFITANGDTEADELLQASANVISACMEIEASGVRVNLYVGFLSEKLEDTVGFVMRIKSASQPFDVLKMAYPLAHPSMLRRHFFKAMEVTKDVPTQFAPTYGHALSDAKEIRHYTESITKNMQAVYSYYDAKGKTVEEIKEMIVRGNK